MSPLTHPTALPRATHGSPDRPLRIGDIEIPCYVLDRLDDHGQPMRVIVQQGMLGALQIAQANRERLRRFVEGNRIKPFISEELFKRISNPIRFRPTRGRIEAYGYEATVLADLCDAVLEAWMKGMLEKRQEHIALRASVLIRGFAKVGIIALVDEATGYQADRDRNELHKILAAYISPDLMTWTQRFPEVFYQEMFRLQGWDISQRKGGRAPMKAGELTAQIVYEKLPHGVLTELRRRNPVVDPEKHRRRNKHHQYLSPDIGHDHLEKHIIKVVTLMQASDTWRDFLRSLHRVIPTPEPLGPLFERGVN